MSATSKTKCAMGSSTAGLGRARASRANLGPKPAPRIPSTYQKCGRWAATLTMPGTEIILYKIDTFLWWLWWGGLSIIKLGSVPPAIISLSTTIMIHELDKGQGEVDWLQQWEQGSTQRAIGMDSHVIMDSIQPSNNHNTAVQPYRYMFS